MTSGVTLSGGGVTVDFNGATAKNVTVTHRFSNPFIKLPTPIQLTDEFGKNVKLINIGFMSNSFDLSFQLTDGPGAFNFGTKNVPGGTTNYEKIIYIASNVLAEKTLTLNGTAIGGQIENVNIPWKAGMKDLTLNGTFSFCLGKSFVTS